jgi:hypothetical protein
MGYTHSWEWKTGIADASRFAAWSRDLAHLQRDMATPGRLLPWEVPVTGKWGPGAIKLVLESPQHESLLKGLQREKALELSPSFTPALIGFDSRGDPIITVPSQEPQPFTPVLIRGPDGTGEPIFTPTEVTFNGDRETNDSLQDFRITFDQLQAPYYGFCKTNLYSYDILVRCAIVRLAHYFPAVRVSSDGGKSALKIPVAICRYVFEDETAFPLWAYDDEGEEV